MYTGYSTWLKIKLFHGNNLYSPQLRSPPPAPNFRLTLSQQAPSSTNSHQNSNTRDILSLPQPNNPPRQQKQTGGVGRGRRRERGWVRKTEKKGEAADSSNTERERGRERVSEKGRRHNNRRGKLRRSREDWKTLTIGKHRGSVPYREICLKWSSCLSCGA